MYSRCAPMLILHILLCLSYMHIGRTKAHITSSLMHLFSDQRAWRWLRKKTRCRCARIKFKNTETLEFKIHKHLASLLWRNIPGVLSKFPGFEVCRESFLQPNLSIGPADRSLSIQTHLRHGPTRSNKVEQGRKSATHSGSPTSCYII